MKKLTAKSFLTKLKEYLFMTVAGIVNGFSMYTFVNPAHLVAGGFSGLSSALTYIIAPLIPGVEFENLVSIVYLGLNIPLLICSLIFLRGDFTFKTIWATVVCTATLAILPAFPELQFNQPNARLISVIFGGILIGYAMYIAAEYNGSNGGTEVIARIVAKYHPEMDLSKVILIANVAINVLGSVIVIFKLNESPAIAIYSLMYIFVGTTVLGMLARGFNHPQKFLIVTTEYEQIMEDITTHFKRGCSCMDVVSKDPDSPERKMVMVIVQYRQMAQLKRLICHRDPHAFTIVKDVHDVFSRPTFNRSYKTK
ncbi:MAG: YitT family protein [Clostridiales bacterium]|nr:YitT family protein [Clostridiales bacterium]